MTPIHVDMKNNNLVVLDSYSLIEQHIRLNISGHLASSFPIAVCYMITCSPYSRQELKVLLQNSCQLIEKSMSSNLVYFVSRTYFGDELFPFSLLSILSSHITLGIPLCLFPCISNFITTLIDDSSSLLTAWQNPTKLVLVDYLNNG